MQKIPSETYVFMYSAKDMRKEIRRKEIRAKALRESLKPSGIDYSGDTVQTSPTEKMSETMAEVIDLEQEIKVMWAKYADRVREIDDLISRLHDTDEELVMSEFYLAPEHDEEEKKKKPKIEKIAEQISYSVRQTYRIKDSALMKITDMLKDGTNGRA